jgi:predicted lipoprotein with Yx(FWY)xxD motif
VQRFPVYAVAALAAALLAAGCGSSGKSSTTGTSASSSTSTSSSSAYGGGGASTQSSSSSAAAVKTASGSLGTYLADAKGRTVYIFLKDKTSKSTCTGACAQDWPPLTTSGAPSAGAGLTASMLGTTMRADGTTQVTYAGHPLYYYSDDGRPGVKAGATKGEGENAWGGEWYVVGTDGKKVENEGS